METPRKDALLPEEEKPKQSYTSLLRDKNVLITILLYGIEALCQVSYDSLTSLWLSSSRADGGMNWSVMDIGWFMCFVCPMQMGNRKRCVEYYELVVVFPIMSQALSVTVTYTTISFLQAILLLLTPFVTLLPNQIVLPRASFHIVSDCVPLHCHILFSSLPHHPIQISTDSSS